MKIGRKNIIAYIFTALILVYFILSFALPTNHATMVRYHLTPLSLRFLDLTVLIPLVVIYCITFYGYSRLYSYARIINKTKDGKELAKLAQGLGILALGQPAKGIVTAILKSIAQDHHRFTAAATIINNYLGLLVPLLGFIFISEGAYGLTILVKKRPTQRATEILAAILILVGVGYCYLIFNNGLSILHTGVTSQIYYLPNVVLLLTLVAPYILMWFMGIFAAYYIYLYQNKVSGILYKQSMKQIYIGLSAIIIISILLQYLTTLSNHLLGLKVGSLLLIIYPLLILMSIGYVLVALGAKKLQKIEEV